MKSNHSYNWCYHTLLVNIACFVEKLWANEVENAELDNITPLSHLQGVDIMSIITIISRWIHTKRGHHYVIRWITSALHYLLHNGFKLEHHNAFLTLWNINVSYNGSDKYPFSGHQEVSWYRTADNDKWHKTTHHWGQRCEKSLIKPFWFTLRTAYPGLHTLKVDPYIRKHLILLLASTWNTSTLRFALKHQAGGIVLNTSNTTWRTQHCPNIIVATNRLNPHNKITYIINCHCYFHTTVSCL